MTVDTCVPYNSMYDTLIVVPDTLQLLIISFLTIMHVVLMHVYMYMCVYNYNVVSILYSGFEFDNCE